MTDFSSVAAVLCAAGTANAVLDHYSARNKWIAERIHQAHTISSIAEAALLVYTGCYAVLGVGNATEFATGLLKLENSDAGLLVTGCVVTATLVSAVVFGSRYAVARFSPQGNPADSLEPGQVTEQVLRKVRVSWAEPGLQWKYKYMKAARTIMALAGMVCVPSNALALGVVAATGLFSLSSLKEHRWLCIAAEHGAVSYDAVEFNTRHHVLMTPYSAPPSQGNEPPETCTLCLDPLRDRPASWFCEQHAYHNNCLTAQLMTKVGDLQVVSSLARQGWLRVLKLWETVTRQNGIVISRSYSWTAQAGEEGIFSDANCRDQPGHMDLSVAIRHRDRGWLPVGLTCSAKDGGKTQADKKSDARWSTVIHYAEVVAGTFQAVMSSAYDDASVENRADRLVCCLPLELGQTICSARRTIDYLEDWWNKGADRDKNKLLTGWRYLTVTATALVGSLALSYVAAMALTRLGAPSLDVQALATRTLSTDLAKGLTFQWDCQWTGQTLRIWRLCLDLSRVAMGDRRWLTLSNCVLNGMTIVNASGLRTLEVTRIQGSLPRVRGVGFRATGTSSHWSHLLTPLKDGSNLSQNEGELAKVLQRLASDTKRSLDKGSWELWWKYSSSSERYELTANFAGSAVEAISPWLSKPVTHHFINIAERGAVLANRSGPEELRSFVPGLWKTFFEHTNIQRR